MSEAAYIFVVLFLSAVAEVLAGSFGILFPSTILAVFYVGVVYGPEIGLVAGAAAGAAVDLLYGRGLLLSPWLMMMSAAMAAFWLRKGDTKIPLMHVLPGAVVALVWSAALTFSSQGAGDGVFFMLSQPVLAVILGALWLPALIWALDKGAGFFGFEDFKYAKQRLAERSK